MLDKPLILEMITDLADLIREKDTDWQDARNTHRAIGQHLDPTSEKLASSLQESVDMRDAASSDGQHAAAASFQRIVLALRKQIEDEAAQRAAAERRPAEMTRVEFLESRLADLIGQAEAYKGRDGQAYSRMSAQILTVREALDQAKAGVEVEETEEQTEAGVIADLCTMGEAQVGRILRAVLEHRPDLWRRVGTARPVVQ